MKKKILAVFLALIVFNLLFFPFPSFFGTFGFLGFIIATQFFLFLSARENSHPKNYFLAKIASGIAIFASFIAIFKGSFIDAFLLSAISISFSCVSLYLLILPQELLGSIVEFVLIPVHLLASWFVSAGNIFDNFTKSKSQLNFKVGDFVKIKRSNLESVWRGLLIAIPVTGVIIFLLASADPIFSKVLSDFITIRFPQLIFPEWLAKRSLWSLAFVAFAFPVAFLKLSHSIETGLENKDYGKYKIEATTVIGMLALVFAFFLIVQFKYLFSTVLETELIQFGVRTYSEYVRKGFAELILVSMIVYFAIEASLIVLKKATSSKNILEKLNFILLAEALVFMFSILRRVYLYQVEHGLTRIRVYGSAFVVLMMILTLLLVLKHIYKNKNWYLYQIASVVIVVFVVSAISVDKMIANNFPPTVNREVDYVYISKLSSEAVDGQITAYKHAKNEIDEISKLPNIILSADYKRKIIYAYETLDSLLDNYLDLKNTTESEFKYQNFADLDAYKRWENTVSFDELKHYQEKATNLINTLTPAERNQNLDRSLDTPLLR